jgi:hypothetical protein
VRFGEWFNTRAAQKPTKWTQLRLVLVLALWVWRHVQLRGWGFGIAGFIVFGGVLLSAAVSSATTTGRSWSQRHPYTDGAILGPLLFLALETLPSLSVWWCAVGGIVGVIAGVALGSRRARRQRSASSTT